jgi:hypothetical protein
MEDPNIADGNPVTNKVQVNLHVLRPLLLNQIGGDVVAVDECALGERAMELSQELSKPGRLCHVVGNSKVLRLGTGAGGNWLPLGRQGDEVVAQEHGIAGGGAASVWTASPVSIGVDNHLSRGGVMKK